MHGIRLCRWHRPEKKSPIMVNRYFRLFLDDRRFYFTSERKLTAFLNEINRHLNMMAMDINILVGECYMEYRFYFFHLDTLERNMCETQFAGINKTFGLLTERFDTVNGNGFTYQRFNRILLDLNAIVKHMEAHPTNNNSTVQRYRIKNLLSRIELSRERLKWHPDYTPPKYAR